MEYVEQNITCDWLESQFIIQLHGLSNPRGREEGFKELVESYWS